MNKEGHREIWKREMTCLTTTVPQRQSRGLGKGGSLGGEAESDLESGRGRWIHGRRAGIIWEAREDQSQGFLCGAAHIEHSQLEASLSGRFFQPAPKQYSAALELHVPFA